MIKAIVTDIEGTTTSIDFVYKVLFPYAREKLAEFVRCNAKDADLVSYINDVRLQAKDGLGLDLDLEGVISQLEQWMAQDKKVTALKGLQGLVWEAGYKNGDFQGHMYADVYENLRAWHDQGIALYIYSSGSIKAQKLLFGHTEYGDLNALFSGYFDTTTGAKTEVASYQRIVQHIGLPADQTVFLSDIEAELAAAQQAGMQTFWLVRESELNSGQHAHKDSKTLDNNSGNSIVTMTSSYRQVKDFNEISKSRFELA